MGVLTKSQKEEISEIIKMTNNAMLTEENYLDSIANKIFLKMEANIRKITDPLIEKINKLEEANEDLQSKLDSLEQYSRRQCLRFYGIDENDNENVENKVLNIINNNLKLNEVSRNHIDRCHRTGKKFDNSAQNQGARKPRPIIVKFVSYKQRQLVFQNKKLLKGSGIKICEDLTKTRLSLMHNVIQKYGYRNVWTLDGSIVFNHNNKKVMLRTMKDFDKFNDL